MIEKMLDAVRLEPVTDFEPLLKLKISRKNQLLVRGIGICLLFWIITAIDAPAPKTLMQFITVLFLGEVVWDGMQKMKYAADVAWHMLVIGVWTVMSLCTYNIFIAIALLGICKALYMFDFQDLLVKDNWTFRELVSWRNYHDREIKKVYGIIGGIAILIGLLWPETVAAFLKL